MMRSRVVAVWVLLSLSGCELFGAKPTEPPPLPEPKAPSPRLAPWLLPFTLADDLPITDGVSRLNFERAVEVGPQVGLSLFHATRNGLSELVQDSMLAVAALPDRVVVVFPEAPDGQLKVAQGGLDRPWTAQPLDAEAPLLRWQVGALDAVAAPDGSVLIAVRRRPFGLVLYRWTTDGVVTKERLPVQAPFSEHWSTSRCPDVRLDASEKGGVVLAFHAGKRTALAWRKPGATTWTEHLTPPLEYDDTVPYDLGCTNRVVFDDSGFPQLLTLVRTFSRKPTDPVPYDPQQPGTSDPVWNLPDFHPKGLVGRSPPVTGMHGYVMRADGLLTRSASVARPEASIDVTHPWHPGFFAFDRHPAGYLVSGPNVSYAGGTLSYVRLRAQGPARDPAAAPPLFELKLQLPAYEVELPGGGTTTEPDPSELSVHGSVEHVAFDPCGAVMLHGARSERTNLRRSFTQFTGACPNTPLAPVARAPGPGYDMTPAFAHGRRPYEVGVCAQSNLLAICHGGHELTLREHPADDTAARLVSTLPAAGEVPLTTDRVTFTLSRAVAADERVYAVFSHVDALDSEQVTPVVDGATVTVVFPKPLVPGSTWRVALSVTPATSDTEWLYLDGGAPVVTFTTATSAGVVDPRVSPAPFRCDGVRVNGTCELTERVRGVAGEWDDVGRAYDYAARPLGVPSVYDAQGARVMDASAQVLPTGQTRFTWGSTLARDARYEVRFPEGIVTFDGTEWFPEDLKLVFFTRP